MDDFSTNRHDSHPPLAAVAATRHPQLSFADGNIAVLDLTGSVYFLVHQGLLCRHSVPLQHATNALDSRIQLEGRPILRLQDSSHDIFHFLTSLYDGLSIRPTFQYIAALLRLTTKYEVTHLRTSLLRELQRVHWPVRLAQWEVREAEATDSSGNYDARAYYTHPILVINLAREINAPEILPSAYYDLSRNVVSETTEGFTDSDNVVHRLAADDLMNLLKGREHGSRFLSTFIVNELEGREPSAGCVHNREEDMAQRRACQAAFESITFEILRDVNGVTHRSSDPLFAIVDAELMQTRDDGHGSILRACESCRGEFGAAVDQAREEFWSKLPGWFGVDLEVELWS
ncbi:hypothetical protein FB45DRAFT_893265 [Roridomyces roridus]|uniref:BTB domain-containing protein n=1 Tax=Roridomyces roridus TaxID=1738132 RepID=A0AAD7CHI2_9AGAR|nr:hypothetical protein FB45DRAFT_893265 [Roridomyces roridus]